MTQTSLTPVEVPDIGDFADVPVIEIHVAPGDVVQAEDPLLTLESDKATMDVPAPSAGTVREVLVKVGDRVSQGAVILSLEPAEGGAPPGEAPAAPAPPPSAPSPAAADPARASGPIYASPSVRRYARERGVDLRGATGSGRNGRLTKDDVEHLARGTAPAPQPASGAPAMAGLTLAPWPTPDFAKQGEIERVPLTRIQRISGPNLARNWAMIPHVTQFEEADVTELEAFRKALNAELGKQGVKLTMLAFLVKAAVSALQAFPTFNSSLDGEQLVLKRYWNIGFAADTPNGLVVPVIKGAESKGIVEIATELGTLSAKAREGKLGPAEMSGATFTISSLGGIGGTSFTPIINAPEVAILGVSRTATKPVWDGTAFAPRLMLPLSLSYDHRVIDGAAAARFAVHLGAVLSDMRRALL